MDSLEGVLVVEGAPHRDRQVRGPALAPVVEEHDAGALLHHLLVIATMLIPLARMDFGTGCSSSSRIAESPSKTALSSVAAKAAQECTHRAPLP